MPPAKNVLILYSFTAREAMNEFDSLKSTLRAQVAAPVNFQVEYLESTRFNIPGYEHGLAESMAATYRGQKIDLVVAAFYPALEFAVENRDRMFPGAPIVFFSVSPKRIEGRKLWPGVTGITIGGDVGGTIDLALRLQPGSETLAIVTGDSPFERFWLEITHRELRKREPALRPIDLVNLPTNQLLSEVAALPPNTVVLFEAIPQDSSQSIMGTYTALSAISEILPTYCLQNYCLDHGVVGGSYADFSEQGVMAGRIAARVLSGEDPESIPVSHGSPAVAHVDWRQLQHWKMSEAALPAGAIVLYRKPGFWRSFRFTLLETVLFAIIAAVLALLAVEFSGHRRQRRKYRLFLQQGEQRFQAMTDAISLMIWMSDEKGRITYVNQAALNFTGLDPGAGDWMEGIHPDDLPGLLLEFTRAVKQRGAFSKEFRLRRADGEYRWVQDLGTSRFNSDGSFAGLIGYASDITEQRLAQEALRNVGGRLIEAQEKERSRIARELHDDICQKLALLAMELEMSKRNCDVPGGAVERRIEEMRLHCSGIASDVQALSHELHSSRLDYLGLTVALQSFCYEFSQQQNINVDFKCENVPAGLSKEVCLSLFRIAQEGLHNCLKYSGTDRFSVLLRGAAGGVELQISDSGEGFDVEMARGGKGLGLISMEERAHLVNASFTIDSSSGAGTTILVKVPAVEIGQSGRGGDSRSAEAALPTDAYSRGQSFAGFPKR